MPHARLQTFLANTNCIGAETYARWHVKKANTPAALKADLLGSLNKFHEEMLAFCKSQDDTSPPEPLERWIDFAAVAATAETTNSRGKGVEEEQLLPKVIEYDPVTAQPLTSQIEREEGPKHTSVEVVPWKAWCVSKTALALGEEIAYKAAITMVLRAHHISAAETNQNVQICLDVETGKRWVRAQKAIEPEQLRLFPGAPRAAGFCTQSDNPCRATFQVTLKASEGGDNELTMREFHLSPEFKLPEVKEKATAVAGATAGAGLGVERVPEDTAVAVERYWSWTGAESVYPYWGVTRCCNAEMRKMQAQDATSTLRFNLAIHETQYANVTVGKAGRNMTFTVMVPVLTNNVALEEGEQLCFEIVRKAAALKRKVSNWRTDATCLKRGRPPAVAADQGKRVNGKPHEVAGSSSVTAVVDI